MEISGRVIGGNKVLNHRYLVVSEIGKPFIARYGDLKGKQVITLNFIQVIKSENQIIPFEISSFNGIKSFVPANSNGICDYQVREILKIEFSAISKFYGVDIFGNATINHKYLKKISDTDEIEDQSFLKLNSGGRLTLEGQKIFESFILQADKEYKYNAVKRYLSDDYLKEKYKVALENIDEVYKGPGAQFKYNDLIVEFEK